MFARRSFLLVLSLAPGLLACSSSSSNETPDDAQAPGADASLDGSGEVSDTGASDAGASDAGNDVGPSSNPGAPSLTALGVVPTVPTDASAGLTLVPPFSPSIHDYYVRCAAGTNALTVSMSASSGAQSALVPARGFASRRRSQTLPVSVTENQAIVAVATDGTATAEYWVRCLPHDFPAARDERAPRRGHAAAGLLPGRRPRCRRRAAATPWCSTATGCRSGTTRCPPGLGASDVDARRQRRRLLDAVLGRDRPGPFEIRAARARSRRRTIAPAGYTTDVHELRVLPNGELPRHLVSAAVGRRPDGVDASRRPATAAPRPRVRTRRSRTARSWSSSPTGTVVWTWLASDHFDPAADSTLPLTGFGAGSTAAGRRRGRRRLPLQLDRRRPGERQPPGLGARDGLGLLRRAVDGQGALEDGRRHREQGRRDLRLGRRSVLPCSTTRACSPGWSPTCNGGSGQISRLRRRDAGSPVRRAASSTTSSWAAGTAARPTATAGPASTAGRPARRPSPGSTRGRSSHRGDGELPHLAGRLARHRLGPRRRAGPRVHRGRRRTGTTSSTSASPTATRRTAPSRCRSRRSISGVLRSTAGSP